MSGDDLSRRGDASARVFGVGENPVLWSLPFFAIRGCVVRLHLVFVVFLAVRVIQSVQLEQAGLVFQLGGLAGLLLLMVAHEAAHVVAARRCGVTHDRVMLWPLGGLLHGDEPGDTGRRVRIAAAGPLLNLILVVPLAGFTLFVTGSWEFVFFNPFAYRATAGVASADGLLAWFVWSLHANNAMLLLFNLLVPMHPLDAGRLLQAALSARRGEAAAARVSGAIGLVSAAVLACIGLIANETVLLGIAFIGAFVSWQEASRSRFLYGDEQEDGHDWISPPTEADADPIRQEPDPEEIDRILAKIGEAGMSSLSAAERASLDRASKARSDAET